MKIGISTKKLGIVELSCLKKTVALVDSFLHLIDPDRIPTNSLGSPQLEHEASIEELLNLFWLGESPNKSASVRIDGHESEKIQAVERVLNGSSANPEFLRQFKDIELLTGA